MGDDKAGFAKRLREAMRKKGWDERPSELHARFNSRYRGRSVSFQTASGWMLGKTLPRHEKVAVLAEMLGESPEYLLFGQARARAVREATAGWPPAGVTPRQRALIDRILALSDEKQGFVENFVAAIDAKPATRR